MSYTYYSSADAGAPVLNGTAGSLITWLDTICVGSGTAYGSKPKKGWTKSYSGTNKGVYRTADGIGYYRVQHDGAQGAASFREAVVRGAESATDVDTLVDPFPVVAQLADAACVWRVSDTADSAARPWVAIVGPSFLALRMQHATTVNGTDLYLIGRFAEAAATNAWPHLLTTRATANSSSSGGLAVASFNPGLPGTFSSTSLWAMRTPDGVIKAPRATFLAASSSSGRPGNLSTYPMPDSLGRVNREPINLMINNSVASTLSAPFFGGTVPCLWAPLHGQLNSATRDDTFSDAGYDPDAVLAFWGSADTGTFHWRLIAEISDTWVSPYG